MPNSTSTAVEKAVIIPGLRCDGVPFSIEKLPVPVDVTMDTTDLAGFYGFNSRDTNGGWSTTPVISVDGVITRGSDTVNGCTVAKVGDSDNWTTIGWDYAVTEDDVTEAVSEISRWVKSPFEWPCWDPDTDNFLMAPSPVTYATNKPSYLPAPVFNPNQSAGGGGTVEGLPPVLGQVTSVDYSKNEATVQLYGLNASGDLVLTNERVTAIIL